MDVFSKTFQTFVPTSVEHRAHVAPMVDLDAEHVVYSNLELELELEVRFALVLVLLLVAHIV